MSFMQTLTLTRPDDWHLHVRDGAAMRAVVPHTRAPVRPRDHHAEPEAAGDDCGAGRSRIATAFSPARPTARTSSR